LEEKELASRFSDSKNHRWCLGKGRVEKKKKRRKKKEKECNGYRGE